MNHSPTDGAVSAAPITLPLSGITADPAIQQRVEMDPALIGEYAENIGDWIASAPVIIFAADGVYWLADGFHRLAACQAAGLDSIPAVVHQGGRRDALLYAASANAAHGKRRTNADKRRAVETLLSDDEWSQWSDRRIAEAAGVSNTFAGNLRRQVATVAAYVISEGADDQSGCQRLTPEISESPDPIQFQTDPVTSDEPTEAPPGAPEPAKRIGRDGKSYSAPAPKSEAVIIEPMKGDDLDGIRTTAHKLHEMAEKTPAAPTPTPTPETDDLDRIVAQFKEIAENAKETRVPDRQPPNRGLTTGDAMRAFSKFVDALTYLHKVEDAFTDGMLLDLAQRLRMEADRLEQRHADAHKPGVK